MKFHAVATILMGLFIINTAIAQLLQASLAVIVIAGVAIAKEKLIAAEIHRNYIKGYKSGGSGGYAEPSSGYGQKRVFHKRAAEEVDFDAMFQSALELDTDDCAKLMVCHVFEKPAQELNTFEQKIRNLFANDGSKVDAASPRAEFQLAAYVGGLRQAGLCHQRYPKCLANPEELVKVL